MSTLSKTQIDELKNRGFITHVISSDDLVGDTVDGLKNKLVVTSTDKSSDIEEAITPLSITIDPHEETASPGSGKKTFHAIVTPESAKPKITWSSTSDKITFEYPPEEDPSTYGYVLVHYTDLQNQEEITITATADGVSDSAVLKVIGPM